MKEKFITEIKRFWFRSYRFCVALKRLFLNFLHKIYLKLHLNEVVYFYYYLTHRYKPGQMDLRLISKNICAIFQVSPKEGLESTRHGELRILKTRWRRVLFSLRNILLFGAPASRVRSVVYFTYVTITLELNNPFDKGLLMFFLEKKIALLHRMLKRVERVNGKLWDQSLIRLHIDAFHRNSLLQYRVIENMHKAVKRQGTPTVIEEAREGLKKGLFPILITEGCSGAYWMRNANRQVIGLFKPFDEEIHAPNNPIGSGYQGALGQRRTRWGCRVGEAAHHEVGAFLVDSYFGFGIVPRTYYAEFTHRTFFLTREDRYASYRPDKTKYGSFQEFVEGYLPLTDVYESDKDVLPLLEFQLLVILDVVVGNTDRNTGNILVGDETLAAIDHGLCFPDVNKDLNFWYWYFDPGKEPLIASLVELLKDFPFDALSWKLKKKCFISLNSLNRMRERVVLFREAILAGFVPKQLVKLMKPDYLLPLTGYSDLLQEKAREQLNRYIESEADEIEKGKD